VSVGWRHGIISANIGYKIKLVAIRDAKRPEGTPMKLEGIHHVTAITADAPRNVDFYTRVLGLRLVKKTVNQDDPTVYHLFYADENGSPGSDITFFEYPGLPRGRAGAGMVHTVAWRVGSPEAFGFWADRLGAEGIETQRDADELRFSDPEGMGLALRAVERDDEPLVAVHPEIPADLALQGFDGVRGYASEPEASRPFLEEALSFEPQDGATWEVRGDDRGSLYGYDAPPDGRGLSGAGTVHHVAWASPADEHEAWRDRVAQAGARPTPVIDRFYFRSIYFREPSGVLFELATLGPGFTADESQETLGEALSLPPAYEPLRERLEHVLTPLPDPGPARTAK
jgi:glyoxalase family protein